MARGQNGGRGRAALRGRGNPAELPPPAPLTKRTRSQEAKTADSRPQPAAEPEAAAAAAADEVFADADPPLQKLKTRYTEQWTMVKKEMPTWEEVWAPADWSSIKHDIEHYGVDPPAASGMATLLRQHFDASEGAAQASRIERAVAEIVTKNDKPEDWKRPTPRPDGLFRSQPLLWPGTNKDCSTTKLPLLHELKRDGRTTTLGIGNAFGTGKTEVAINGAEVTAEQEPGVRVAYMSFSNGYGSSAVVDTLHDDSLVVRGRARSKYAGLWLYAAKKATRVVDRGAGKKEVQGNAFIFGLIVAEFVSKGWRLPHYLVEAHSNLIVIIDEVQRFTYDQLDRFVSDDVVTASTRLSLLVGAFDPSFVFPSGNRMVNMRYPLVSDTDMNRLFKQRVLHVDPHDSSCDGQMWFQGIHLPSLFGHAVRPVCAAEQNFDLYKDQHPIRNCQTLFDESTYTKPTPGILFRAALADVPAKSTCLENAFKANNLSLGSAYVSRVSNDWCKVDQPPLLVTRTQFELLDTVDADAERAFKATVSDFADPGWQEFEALATVAPALRLAALSASAMGYDTGRRTALELLFSSANGTTSGKALLDHNIKSDLKVRDIYGGKNQSILRKLDQLKKPNEILRIHMGKDHDSPFDGYLVVPVQPEAGVSYILFCVESKFSDAERAYLNYKSHVRGKVEHFVSRKQVALPADFKRCLLLISNREAAGGGLISDVDSKIPVLVCTQPELKDCFSSCLVPPKVRRGGTREGNASEGNSGQ